MVGSLESPKVTAETLLPVHVTQRTEEGCFSCRPGSYYSVWVRREVEGRIKLQLGWGGWEPAACTDTPSTSFSSCGQNDM